MTCISDAYAQLNRELHQTTEHYGTSGASYAASVLSLATAFRVRSILDYGCGKGTLAKTLSGPVREYDPAIPGKDAPPDPADLVVVTDVLEHVEPECLDAVLEDLERCVKIVGYFVICTRPSKKQLADGRNAHLIQQPALWWLTSLGHYFTVVSTLTTKSLLHVAVSPKNLILAHTIQFQPEPATP
jgi:2-polyprenyl-3-methyl-5-hydroxy-6-metoxy-1,4-benzoquinol methylase